jgi:hypothetical protein
MRKIFLVLLVILVTSIFLNGCNKENAIVGEAFNIGNYESAFGKDCSLKYGSCVISENCATYSDSSLGDNGHCDCVNGCCDCSEGSVSVTKPEEVITNCKIACGENMVDVCGHSAAQNIIEFTWCYKSCIQYIPFNGCKGIDLSCTPACWNAYELVCGPDFYDACINACD